MTTKTHACLRWMIRRDLPSVMDIEAQSFEYPWTEGEFLACSKVANNISMVAEVNEDVVGYMVYKIHKKKIELLSFAVHPKYRQSGVGRSLIGRLISKLDVGRRSKIVVSVRDSNLPAQLFFRSMGFFCTKVEKNCYEDCDDNAYVMEYFL